MDMLLKENKNSFAMKYILSEDVETGELRNDLLESRYYGKAPARRKETVSKKQRMADLAWERFVARQSLRTRGSRLKAAMTARLS
jgi:hypothetical protein